VNYAASIATGPDGALWFTNGDGASIGRLATDGHFRYFSDPGISYPSNITVGPDGAMWFTMDFSNGIGRIKTTTG
jgi:virginiamycin B lyase